MNGSRFKISDVAEAVEEERTAEKDWKIRTKRTICVACVFLARYSAWVLDGKRLSRWRENSKILIEVSVILTVIIIIRWKFAGSSYLVFWFLLVADG